MELNAAGVKSPFRASREVVSQAEATSRLVNPILQEVS